MPDTRAAPLVRAHGEVRGTQSFVGVMVMVWRRPLLTAIEVAWRWAAGASAIAFGGVAVYTTWVSLVHAGEWRAVQASSFTLTDPMSFAGEMRLSAEIFLPPLLHAWWWVLLVAATLWIVAATIGRVGVARRLDPRLRPAFAAVAALTALRLAALALLAAVWFALLYGDARWTIAAPMLRGGEPNLVLYFALAVSATLALFMVWSVLGWVLRLAPLLAMAGATGAAESVRAAWGKRGLRPKLVEINLVMGIVKIALVVLLMVFSATPLPFESFTTQTFLWGWWAALTLIYLVLSDYFHVVHTASFLLLWQDSQ